MKKKIILTVLLLLLSLFTGCVESAQKSHPNDNNIGKKIEYITAEPSEEMRAVWITCYELSMQAENGGSKESFTKKISTMFDNIVNLDFNTVIVHVRPFSDSFYPSKIFPTSKFLTGIQGGSMDYDPLLIITQEAKNRDLKIHAWINPYRVSYSTDLNELSPNNPARQWREDELKENDSWVIICNEGIYYNPGVIQVQKLIIDGVREIITNYGVDAIHMDDYFYPTTSAEIDSLEYNLYTQQGGNKSLMDWRRENVNSFLLGLYSAIKAKAPNVDLGISPAGNLETNYQQLGADIYEWGSKEGYVDYLIPQIYFGFNNETTPFIQTSKAWADVVTNKSVKLYYGLALYKCGYEDEFAGKESNLRDSPRYEWQNNSDIISRQITHLRNSTRYDGFALYSYSYIFSENATQISKKEVENIKNML